MKPASLSILSLGLALSPSLTAATLVGWNNLGMHCMDSDYSVFSVLPPYNTIECQLVVNGRLVTNGAGYTVSYQAIADPDGSFNSTAMGKGNFYRYASALYGASPEAERGLAGWAMPGVSNLPQALLFEPTNQPAPGVATPVHWFRAEGIPIAPYDDAGRKNAYPLMRLIARNSANQPIATNDIVLPVSDEMDCRACHASGTRAAAQPAGGWVWDGLPERDYRLNILRLHDELEFSDHGALYRAALAARGFNPQGLYRGVLAEGKPVLCAACHASEALGAPSYGTIPSLTASMHGYHAHVIDPTMGASLDHVANRSACYRCHPGSATRCLRGAMGRAIAADGSMAMQCQSCHGTMSQVGALSRVGWFMEPACQSCHTGTAANNNGQLRFTTAFETNGAVRVPVDTTFATQANTPAPGLSLYRFSRGHGGLQCSACHGSTHAEFPSTHRNDNLRNQALQGHAGVLAECGTCHPATPNTVAGGPHGLHPLGAAWVGAHADALEDGQATRAQCQACHGTDYRGTVLSVMQADRTLTAFGNSQRFFRGAMIGCYACHRGPFDDSANASAAPTVAGVATNTANHQPVGLVLPVTGAGAVLRILSQPANGSVGWSNQVPTYFPNPGFTGTDTFTFAAYDGAKNSTLATGSVVVVQGPVGLSVAARVPPNYPARWPVPFAVDAEVVNSLATPAFDWDFGDGTPHGTNQFAVHSYSAPGTRVWRVIASVPGSSTTNQGTIVITEPVGLRATAVGTALTLSWPATLADVLLERSETLGPTAHWTWVTNSPLATPGSLSVTVPTAAAGFYRLDRPW